MEILRLRTSLQSLHIPASPQDPLYHCIRTVPPGRVTEITVYHPDEVTLGYSFPTPYFSSVTRLTILATPQGLSTLFVECFPNLTHLGTSLYADQTSLDAFTSLEHLTHLWFTPAAARGGHSLFSFLSALPKTIERVRLDVALEAPPDGFSDVDWDSGVLPFVKVHLLSGSDISWRAENMWTEEVVDGNRSSDHEEGTGNQVDVEEGEDDVDTMEDLDSEDSEDAEDAPELLYNVYTDR